MSFDDLIAANRTYAKNFTFAGLSGVASKELAMVTCMDSRIDPLALVGMSAGDMKILRNPGGRVHEPTITSLVLAVHLLGVKRIMIIGHTQCAMTDNTEEQLREKVAKSSGIDTSNLHIGAIADQRQTMQSDITRLQEHPQIGSHVEIGGFIYDVETGLLEQII